MTVLCHKGDIVSSFFTVGWLSSALGFLHVACRENTYGKFQQCFPYGKFGSKHERCPNTATVSSVKKRKIGRDTVYCNFGVKVPQVNLR